MKITQPRLSNTLHESTNIEKLAHIRMKFGGIMQTVGNER